MVLNTIINTDLFVREPVDKINKEILNSNHKRFILTGGRGSGKSTVLDSLENMGLGTEEQTIKTQFDSVGFIGYIPQENLLTDLYRHNYELSFSFKLLFYIKNNYPLLYEKEFKEIYNKLKEIDLAFINAINNGIFASSKLNNFSFLKTMSIVSSLVVKIRNLLELDKLNISIDRFDWTNNSSKLSQEILADYFSLFDKVILTSDDDSICDIVKYKDYILKRINYGRDIEVVKMILQKYLGHNKKYKNFDINNISDKVVERMVNASSNNISCMLKAIDYLGKINDQDIEKQTENIINDEVRRVRELKEISIKKKLYL